MEAQYAQVGKLQAVELPYDGQELSMVVLLPESSPSPPCQARLGAITGNLGIFRPAPVGYMVGTYDPVMDPAKPTSQE
jgi:hypothetical protein